ncbi:MAG: PQQ-binding-like beta-propeller repeat protein [Candidatus Marinimicrobia bacterium]|nr:PQQ-binding-like beta-propeller repeat protein [Candidatus Neomarinimicrobiota bacterium]
MNFNRIICLQLIILSLGINHCAQGLREAVEFSDPADFPVFSLAKKPELIWKRHLSSPPKDMMVVNNKRLLINTYRGEIFIIQLENGKKVKNTWRPFRRPVEILLKDSIHHRLFLTAVNENHLLVYNLKTQQIETKYKIKDIGGAILFNNDTVYVRQNETEIVKIDLKKERFIHRRSVPAQITQGLYKSNDKLWLYTADGFIRFYDRNLYPTGQIELPLSINPVFTISGGHCFAADGTGQFCIIKLSEKQIRFEKKYGVPIYSEPLVLEKSVTIGFSDGTVRNLDKNTGAELWHYKGTGLINKPLYAVGSIIVVPYSRGQIVALRSETGEKLWELTFEKGIKQAVVSPNGLIVCDNARNLHYYQVKK